MGSEMCIRDSIGVVPSWIAKAAKLEKGAKPALWLYDVFPDHAKDISREPNTFLMSLTVYLSNNNPDEFITLGTGENILCKVRSDGLLCLVHKHPPNLTRCFHR